jgi:hypothetical protein
MRGITSTFVIACVACLALARPAPCQTTDSTSQNATAFIRTYMAKWSSPNPEALAYMDQVFSNETMYFDQKLNHSAVMQAKRRFAERWPLRRFVVRDDGLSVSCDERRLCTVWGLIDWHCRSPERNADATGTSVFSFQVQDARVVVDEDGFVIARGQILPRVASAGVISPKTYSNADIPKLRQAFFDDSIHRDWIARWLAAKRPFFGVGRSLGHASARDLTDTNGGDMPYAVFQSKEGPIACMMTAKRRMPPRGKAVHIRGTVAIFIDKTLYLSHCSFA